MARWRKRVLDLLLRLWINVIFHRVNCLLERRWGIDEREANRLWPFAMNGR